MPHVTERFGTGPVTYNVGVDTVIGGRLVEVKTDGTIKHTTAATKKCVGIATDDAKPLTGQSTDGYNVSAAIIRDDVAVARIGVYPLIFSVASGNGDFLVADADGKVKPQTVGTTTFDQIVGRCVEKGGVLINTTGLVALINL